MPPRITEIELPINPDDFSKEQLAVALTESRKQCDSLRELLQESNHHNLALELKVVKWQTIAGFFGCMLGAILVTLILKGLLW